MTLEASPTLGLETSEHLVFELDNREAVERGEPGLGHGNGEMSAVHYNAQYD